MNFLAVSGSLRAASTNAAALSAAARLVPPGVALTVWTGLRDLPHFDPDIESGGLPQAVAALRAAVGAADGLVLSTPEYARAMPGSFKNALDWLVGGSEFPDKPVMLINCSPRASAAQDQLRLVVATMSGRLVPEAEVVLPLIGRSVDAAAILADPALSAPLAAGLAAFAGAIVRLRRGE